jgi:molybdate transport system substrate-binding protein
MNPMLSRRAALVVGLSFTLAPSARAAGGPVTVAAAADLQGVLAVLAQAFETETGIPVRVTFGASGNFARQLRQGAPFDLFFSADEELVLALARDGNVRDKGIIYAEGHLALLVHTSSPLAAKPTIDAFVTAVKASRTKRIAIANPEHAPYGQRAIDVLTHLHVLEQVRPKLVYGENVAQAVQFTATGAAEAGIVAQSLTFNETVRATTRAVPIPSSWHRPLLQRMALTPRAGDDAARFYAYVQSPAGTKAFREFGFAVPTP